MRSYLVMSEKVTCNLGPHDESLEMIIEMLNSLPNNELQYVLDNVRRIDERKHIDK